MIKDELAAYTANIIKRVGAEQADVLFQGQIGEAGRVASEALRRGQVSPLCLLKTRKRRASVALLVPRPYRRGHDHASVRPWFPALVPAS